MWSPIDRNAYFCSWGYCALLNDISFITKDFVRDSQMRDAQSLDVILTVRCLLELLHVRHGYSSQSLLSRDELVHAISHHSVNWLAVRCFYVPRVGFF